MLYHRQRKQMQLVMFQLGVLKIQNHWLQMMTKIARHTQTITFYHPYVVLCTETCVSHNTALQSRVHCLTTIFSVCRSQNKTNWRWLTEGEKWVRVTRMFISWCGQWCLAICRASQLTVWIPSHRAHCAGAEEAVLFAEQYAYMKKCSSVSSNLSDGSVVFVIDYNTGLKATWWPESRDKVYS